MKRHIAVSFAALIALIAVTAGTASAADNISNQTSICKVVATHYECDSWSNEQYPVIDLFGDEYVPLFTTNGNIWDAHVNKLAGLILDSNETYILKPGEKIDLGEGYALKVKQISSDYVDVWLELTRNGQHIADQIISVNTDDNRTWNVTLDNIQGENNIVVMKVYVNNVFVGAEDCIVRIDGIWLIDYENVKTLNIGDKPGGFTLKGIINGADSSNLGSLALENTLESSLTHSVVGTNYECDSWSNEQYPVIDLFGDKYVPLSTSQDNIWNSHVNKLASLILDSNETHTLKPGETIDLGHGYALEVKEIDVETEKAWLEFTRSGQHVAAKNVSIDTDDNKTWIVALDNVQGENDIVVMKVHVKQLFVGTETSVIWIDGIWLIDYANARTLDIGDKFGEFTLEEIISGVDISNPGSLVFENTSVADDSKTSNTSASPSPEKGMVRFADKSTGSSTLWYRDSWGWIVMKSK